MKQKYSGEANMHLLQGLGGVRDIKIYGKENYFSNQFSKVNKELTNLMVKYGITNLLPRIYLELVSILGLVTLVLIMLFQNLTNSKHYIINRNNLSIYRYLLNYEPFSKS